MPACWRPALDARTLIKARLRQAGDELPGPTPRTVVAATVTEDALGLAAVYATAFALNAAPGLMPPTWVVVTLLVVQLDLPLFPAALGAVIAGGLGRAVIARYATYARRWLRGRTADLEALRPTLRSRPRTVVVTSFFYSIVLPTNLLFAAAGLSGAGLRWILAGYWLARIPLDTALVWTAESITRDIFIDAYRSPLAIALQVAGIAFFLLVLRLPWARWIARADDEGG